MKNLATALVGFGVGVVAAYWMVDSGMVKSPLDMALGDYIWSFFVTRTILSAIWLVPTFLVGLILLGWEGLWEVPDNMPVVALMHRYWPIAIPASVLFISQMMIMIASLNIQILNGLKVIFS